MRLFSLAFIAAWTLIGSQIGIAATVLTRNFDLSIEEWQKNAEGEFRLAKTWVENKNITLKFTTDQHFNIIETFNGFNLEIQSYVGSGATSLTIEQNLSKDGHPMNDPIVGISRNHFSLDNPNGCQFYYINYYVNLDNNTKLRIRLWDLKIN